jgi:formyl-CoA transferase
VLIENFKPGSMEKWNLGYEDVLSTRFPRLIHCRVSGFGADGPLGGFPGYDAVLQAMVGLMSINGTETSGPTRLGNPVVDIATGLFAAIAILMALHEREKSGRGQFCDMTLHDCGMALLHPHAANFFLNGKRPKATGNPHPNLAPYSKFQTRTCEIFVAAGNDPAFQKFCALLDMPEMASDPRFATNGARVTNREALTAVLNARFANEDGHELSRRMLAAGLPAGPVLNVDETMAADHTAHRKMVTELGAYRGLGTPIKLSRTPGGTRSAPPRFNEHGKAVLRGHGFSDAEIAALAREGVLVQKRRK